MPGTKVKGTKLLLGTALADVVVELESFSLPEGGPITEEDTNIEDDAERRSSTGVLSAGELNGEILFDDARHTTLTTLMASHDKFPWKLKFPSGKGFEGSGAAFRMQITGQTKNFFRASFTVECDGPPAFNAALTWPTV